jgi:hypothetical protein
MLLLNRYAVRAATARTSGEKFSARIDFFKGVSRGPRRCRPSVSRRSTVSLPPLFARSHVIADSHSNRDALTHRTKHDAISARVCLRTLWPELPRAPVIPCQTFEAVPIGEEVRYRIPLVPNARHFKAGHKVRLYLTTDDQAEEKPALLFFRHASIDRLRRGAHEIASITRAGA